MSDKEIQEEVNNDDATEATETPSNPASELVDLVLSGELHAANEKFNGIVEAKVVAAIEDEKLKIAQTLFAEEDDEEEEGDDDDSDDSDSDEGDDKPKKGKVPPQFAKEAKSKVKEDDDDSDDEDDEDDDDEEVQEDDQDDVKAAWYQGDAAFAAHKAANPRMHKKEPVRKRPDMRALVPKGDQERDKDKWYAKKEKKEEVEPVDEISSATADDAAQKAYNDIRDNPSSQKPTLGTTKTAKSDAKRKRQADKFDAYRDSKDFDKKGSKKGGAAKAAGKMGKKSDQQRHTDWRDNPDDQNHGYYVSREDASFDPGEASSNVELPEGSFVAQVASYLSGNRK